MICRPGTVIRPGRVDAAPIGRAPELVTVLDDGLSDFARFLAPARAELAAHRWVLSCDEAYLSFSKEWYREYDEELGDYTSAELREIESCILDASRELGPWTYVEGRYLDAVADTLVDEWWDFFAVDRPVTNLDQWVRDFWAAAKSGRLAEYVHDWTTLWCAGVDGVRWDFFASDERLIEAIHENALRHANVTVRYTDTDEHIRSLYKASDATGGKQEPGS
ncbi:MAG TPA: hypothetical protein VJ725_31465 [Thermoanaerobaculia bacterium]|nr:hypothetical protein [Thermoanaerobaculia bacterium]